MAMRPTDFGGAVAVDGYGPGFFRIGGEVVQGPQVIGPDGITGWGGLADPAPVLALAGKVDVVFLGTGPDVAHIPDDLRETLEEAGLGVEVMSSPAACRTYNILLSEGRRIALALLPV